MPIQDQAPDYVRAIAPYQGGLPIAEIARRYGFLESQVVKLASNENPLGMGPMARAAMAAASQDLGRYPDGNGHDLKAALSRRFDLPADWLTIGNGSNDILELVAHAFLRPGRSSIFSAHSFAVYALVTQATGATAVVVPALPQTLGHDLNEFLLHISPSTAVVWVANPNNPTGSFLPGDEVEAFLEQVPSGVLVVLDEAYTEYLDPEDRYPAFDWVRRFPNLLVSRSFSKAYGLAGLRVGYGVAQPGVTDLLNRVRQPFNVNSLAQAAAAAALFDDDFLLASAQLNCAGLEQMRVGLTALGVAVLPSWGNFVLADLTAKRGGLPGVGGRCFEALLTKGVITRPVGNYGLPDHLRISIGTAAENSAFLEAMAQVLPGLAA